MKLPAFQFYPGDWRKDSGVQSLDFEARGVWFEMLCLMHESTPRGVLTLNNKAMPESALARLLGLDEVLLKQILTKLIEHGVASVEPNTGALMSRRMVRDEKLRQTRAECGKQGGNPRLLKQNPTFDLTTGVKQIPTPSISSSSSVSSSEDNTISPDPALFVLEAQVPPPPEITDDDIYSIYPRKEGRADALRAIKKAMDSKTPAELLDSVKAYAAAVATWPASDRQFVPHPATWFNRGSYDDDRDTWKAKAKPGAITDEFKSVRSRKF